MPSSRAGMQARRTRLSYAGGPSIVSLNVEDTRRTQKTDSASPGGCPTGSDRHRRAHLGFKQNGRVKGDGERVFGLELLVNYSQRDGVVPVAAQVQ